MSDIRFNQWLHQSGTGGVSQVASGAVGVGTTNPLADFYVRGDAQITGILTAGHIAMGSSITFGDNDRIYLGDGTDFQLYHASSDNNSYIVESGAGSLVVNASKLHVKNAANNEDVAVFNQSGNNELYFSNSKKFETTNTGATVTGDITISDKIIHDGDTNTAIRFPAADQIQLETGGSARLTVTDSTTTATGTILANAGVTITDNQVLNLGAANGSDARLWHDNTGGGHTYFFSYHNAGVLKIADDTNVILGKTTNYNYINCTPTTTELFAGGNKKFETTSTGTLTTGDLVVTDPVYLSNASTISSRLTLNSENTSSWQGTRELVALDLIGNGADHRTGTLSIKIKKSPTDSSLTEMMRLDGVHNLTTFYTAGTERLRIASNGDITNTLQDTSFVTTSASSNFAKLDLRGTNIANSNHYILSYGEGHANDHEFHMVNTVGHLVFRTGASGQTERVRINSIGEMSIGGQHASSAYDPNSYGNPSLLIAGDDNADILTLMNDDPSPNNGDYASLGFRVAGQSTGSYSKAAIMAVRNGGYNALDLVFAIGTDADNTRTTTSHEKMRITSGGYVNIGGQSTQTTHMLHLESTGDAGIHIRADSDNGGENDNPYLSMSQDGSTAQQLKMGINGEGGQNFTTSLGNSPFIHANNSASQPLQLVHMDTMVVSIANRKNEIALNDYSGNSVAGMEIQHYGNDTAAALKFTGHNNTGTPGAETYTQLTHKGANAEFEIHHVGSRAMNIGPTRRIRVPGVWGVNGSSMRTVQIESDGNLCAPSSIREAKINIESISDVSWLYDFNPVTFNFRTKTEVNGENVWGDEADDGGLQYGLIADEVEAVNQDLCFYDDGKLSGVHYDRMMSPLIKAVQDQKKEIDALKAKVAALEGS